MKLIFLCLFVLLGTARADNGEFIHDDENEESFFDLFDLELGADSELHLDVPSLSFDNVAEFDKESNEFNSDTFNSADSELDLGAPAVTASQMQCMGVPADKASSYATSLSETLSRFNIGANEEIMALVANCAQESDHWKTTTEYGTRTCAGYEGGCTYKGRGIIQLTHRDAYTQAGAFFGQPFAAQPNLVADMPWAFLTAGWFWTNYKRVGRCYTPGNNFYQSTPDCRFKCAAALINGYHTDRGSCGLRDPSGWSVRQSYYTKAQSCFGGSAQTESAPDVAAAPEPQAPTPQAPSVSSPPPPVQSSYSPPPPQPQAPQPQPPQPQAPSFGDSSSASSGAPSSAVSSAPPSGDAPSPPSPADAGAGPGAQPPSPGPNGAAAVKADEKAAKDAAADAKKTIENAGNKAQNKINAIGSRTRQDVRNENKRDIKDVKAGEAGVVAELGAKESQIAGDAKKAGASIRDADRQQADAVKTATLTGEEGAKGVLKRAADQLEKKVESAEKSGRSANGGLESKIGGIAKSFENGQTRKALRRDEGSELAELKNIKKNLVRESEADSFTDLKKVEKNFGSDLESMVRKNEAKREEKETFRRLGDQAKRNFDKEDSKADFAGMKRLEERIEERKEAALRRTDRIANELKDFDKDGQERRARERMESKMTKESAKDVGAAEKKLEGFEKKFDNAAAADRKGWEKAEGKLGGEIEKAETEKKNEADNKSTRDAMRSVDGEKKSEKSFANLGKKLEKGFEAAKSKARSMARGVLEKAESMFKSKSVEEAMAKVKDTAGAAAKGVKNIAKTVADKVEGAAKGDETAGKENEEMQNVESKVREGDKVEANMGSKIKSKIRDDEKAAKAQRKEMAKKAREQEKISRRNARADAKNFKKDSAEMIHQASQQRRDKLNQARAGQRNKRR